MNDFSLQDVLKAEREAAERLKKAQEDAEKIRAATEKRRAELDKEVSARIEAERRERTERMSRETAEARQKAAAEADAAIAGWEGRYRERCEAIIANICGILTGTKEG